MPDIKNNGGDLNGDSKVPIPDIPDLKKKEKEKKRSGVAWGGGASAAARAAASAAASAAPAAVKVGLGLGAKALLAATAALVIGGGTVVTTRLLSSSRGAGADLGAIPSTIKIHKASADNSKALKYAAQEGRGELKFDQTAKAAAEAQKAEAPEPPAADKAQEIPPANQLTEGGVEPSVPATPQFAHNLSGAKLSTSLGNQFGGKNIFSGNNAPKFSGGPEAPKLKITGARGKAGAMARASNVGAGAGVKGIKGMKTGKALGQLKNMGIYNKTLRQGGHTASEVNSAVASQQWAGEKTAEKLSPTSPTDTLPTVNPMGGGGSAPTNPCTAAQMGAPTYCYASGDSCVCPKTQTGKNVTPWQEDVDKAKKLNDQIPLLLLGAGLLCIAAIPLWFASACSVGSYAYALLAAAAALALYALYLGTQLIALGDKVNAKGGKPQGDIFKRMGIVYMVGAATIAILAISAMIDVHAAAAGAHLTFTVTASIVLMIAAIGPMIWKLIDHPK